MSRDTKLLDLGQELSVPHPVEHSRDVKSDDVEGAASVEGFVLGFGEVEEHVGGRAFLPEPSLPWRDEAVLLRMICLLFSNYPLQDLADRREMGR